MSDADEGRPSFVLHEHRRPQHHFDLRLEEDGVLRSWALPRGLPTDPGENRLAVQVPDHELEHLTYEDEDKSIADIGWWELEDRTDRRFVFVLHGVAGPAPLRPHPHPAGLAAAPDEAAAAEVALTRARLALGRPTAGAGAARTTRVRSWPRART